MRVLLALMVVVCSGCRLSEKPVKTYGRSIDEIFYEAQQASARNPENTVAPNVSADNLLPGEVIVYEEELALNSASQRVDGASSNASHDRVFPQPTRSPIQRVSGTADPTQQRPVSDIFEDTDVRQAIQSLATQAGISVIVDERVGGVTTAFIESEPFEQALRKILLPLGLVYRIHQGQYLIGTTEPSSAMFALLSESIEYRPENLSPQELVPLLPTRLQSYVRVVDKRNLMIIEAPSEMANQIFQQLRSVDQPVPQVMLEAIVCVYNPNESYRFDSELRQALKEAGQDVLDVGSLGLALSGSVSPFGIKNAFTDFATTSLFLRLLAQEGYVTIRAAPRVMAKDGEKATINIARETFFSTTANNADIVFAQNIKQVDAGISLDIVPVIRGDNVTVNIEKAEVSENITTSDTSETLISPFPLINRRQVSTTVHVKDGQTIVIGGLVQRQTIDRVSRVPYLSKIPLFGKVFQRVQQDDTEVEVAIFISPRIIWPEGSRRPEVLNSTVIEQHSPVWESPRFQQSTPPPARELPTQQTVPSESSLDGNKIRTVPDAPALRPVTPKPDTPVPNSPKPLPTLGQPEPMTPSILAPASPSDDENLFESTNPRLETKGSSVTTTPPGRANIETPAITPGPKTSPGMKVLVPKPVLKTVPSQAFP
ncbi:MAG: hypothetical protein R3C01_01780 [Planctomycetaceae bacterium]